jgi:NADH:ubiquinone oxidoreductase subunit E
MDNSTGGEQNGMDLSGVRSGDLAPYEERAPIQPLEDSSPISPGRAIPPAEISAIIERYKHVDPMEAMIPVLQEMQTQFGYITQDAAQQMAEELGLKASEVYGVITFYSFFRYSPRAGHVIMSCEGTSCYVRGAGKIREAIETRLDVGPGDTSADGFFTFEPQSICLGACDLGPLVDIDGVFYSYVTPDKMDSILTQWYEAGDDVPVGDNLTGGHREHYEGGHGFGPTVDDLYGEEYSIERFMSGGAVGVAVAGSLKSESMANQVGAGTAVAEPPPDEAEVEELNALALDMEPLAPIKELGERPTPTPSTTQVVIATVNHTGDEYVELRNNWQAVANIGGWIVRHKRDGERSYVFPDGTRISPGGTLQVYTRPGYPHSFNSPRPIWSDGGDSVELLDHTGNLVSTL